MDAKYAEWIAAYVAAQPNQYVRGHCHKATRAMVEAFPELRRAAGFVFVTWGREEHWWCVAPDSTIVDPTQAQFEAVFEYEELDLDDPKTRERVPIGKCMNCGDETYPSSLEACMCSRECALSFQAYLDSPES